MDQHPEIQYSSMTSNNASEERWNQHNNGSTLVFHELIGVVRQILQTFAKLQIGIF